MLSIILDSLNGWVWPSNILELCENIVTIILISIIYKKKKIYIFIYCFKFKICSSKGFKRKLQNGNFKINTLNVTLSMKHTQSSCSCMNQPRTVNN